MPPLGQVAPQRDTPPVSSKQFGKRIYRDGSHQCDLNQDSVNRTSL
jgi:hypothetical protein